MLAGEGDSVKAGQKIAEACSTGNAAGPCLHFEVRLNGESVEAPAFSSGAMDGSAPQPAADAPNPAEGAYSPTLIEN